VSTSLPYSIKRGEIIAIPISVFNYLQHDLSVEITFYNQDKEFEFIDINDKESRLRRKGASPDSIKTKRVNVHSNDGSSVSFMIRPLKVGYITIKVVATSAVAGDGIERQLLVEPEGITKYMNEAFLIDHDETYELEKEINFTIPSNAIPESIRIEVSATGDILGPSIENLHKLM
jgi:CD109 antigen